MYCLMFNKQAYSILALINREWCHQLRILSFIVSLHFTSLTILRPTSIFRLRHCHRQNTMPPRLGRGLRFRTNASPPDHRQVRPGDNEAPPPPLPTSLSQYRGSIDANVVYNPPPSDEDLVPPGEILTASGGGAYFFFG